MFAHTFLICVFPLAIMSLDNVFPMSYLCVWNDFAWANASLDFFLFTLLLFDFIIY